MPGSRGLCSCRSYACPMMSNLFETFYQRREAVRTLEVPVLDLVLLRIEVLLAARLARRALLQLVRRAIDAVVRRQRRGQHRAHDERRPAAVLQRLVQDVGGVGPAVGPEILPRVGGSELGEVLD